MKTNYEVYKMMKLGFSSIGTVNGVRCLYSYFFLPGFRRISTSSSSNEGNTSSSSFANFLVENLGFSNHQSLSTSATLDSRRRVGGAKLPIDFNWVEKAESVIQFLKQIGFQQNDIRKVVCHDPQILLSRVSQTLIPKIKVLNELGLSGSDLVQVIVGNPLVLRRNLGPAIHAFRTVLGSDENVVRVIKISSRVNFSHAAKYLIPNVEMLQSYCGISGDKLQKHIFHRPSIYCMETNSFRKILIRVEEKLGISRNSAMFVYGIQCVTTFSDKNIYDKYEVFKSFGWTQSDFMKLIRRNPLCLTSNEERIKDRLDFLINQLGYKPDHLASQPPFFTYSIEKRLLPRHKVLQVLKEKGLIKEDYHLLSASVLSEAKFLKRFVFPFEEVHEVYAQLTGSIVESLVAGRIKGQI
ncbi:transcription termination factor MTERF9, chloroplastic-like [Chenopodium quinoa]|uniref:transcription termination factor MTERF9, chloroplastic-like n=1 Tax=Chenopodium quinoa TaxID=63459 RepID=UPI000B789786|nr:transcription termination factor MTERF9, chloroplastic-like [Chenopodium quinoa]XP_021766993.1 transcription termination factor MTERF9, chloroplastic-like [Chenopodium quinoa]